MARRFGRRKPRVLWLPTFGDTSVGESGGASQATGIRFGGSVPSDGAILVDAVAVTWDYTPSATASQGFGTQDYTLADFAGNMSYRLRRIVGKCFCAVSPGADGGAAVNMRTVQIACGFIVGRADPAGAINTDIQVVNPLYQDSAEDPWIWRRTWLLGNKSYQAWTEQTAVTYPEAQFPNTNIAYGSVQDGPHIDQKTARVVGPDERLIFMVAVRQFSDQTTGGAGCNWSVFLDYRLLGSLRPSQGNRRNASR